MQFLRTGIACGSCTLASLGADVDTLVEVQHLQKTSSLPRISDLSLQLIRYVAALVILVGRWYSFLHACMVCMYMFCLNREPCPVPEVDSIASWFRNRLPSSRTSFPIQELDKHVSV